MQKMWAFPRFLLSLPTITTRFMRKGIKILAKIIVGVVLVSIFLPITLGLLLELEEVQSRVATYVARHVSQKLGAEVRVGHLNVGFFNRVAVDDFYVGDLDGDTLLYAHRVEVSIARLGLLRSNPVFDNALLHEGTFHLRESSRGVMNVKEVVDRIRRKEDKEKRSPLTLTFRSLDVEGVEFWLKRNAPRRYETGINWADMRLQELWGGLTDFTIRGSEISGMLNRLSGFEQSGFHIDNFSGLLYISQGRISLTGAQIVTPHSELHIPSLDISGNDWSEYKHFIDRVNMEARFEESSLSSDDLAYFAPKLGDWHLAIHSTNLDLSGTVSALTAKIGNLVTTGGTRLQAELFMRGLPEVKRTRFDVKLNSLRTNIRDMRLLSQSILHKNLPQGVVDMLKRAGHMQLTGRFSGLLSDFTVQALAATKLGSIEGGLALYSEKRKQRALKAHVSTSRFRLGELVGVPDLESATFSARAEGWLMKSGPSVSIVTDISDLVFLGRSYDSLDLYGTVNGKRYQATLHSYEHITDFTLEANADMSRTVPRYAVNLDVRRADLHAMNINRRDSISELSMSLHGDASYPSLNELEGAVWVRDASYRYNDSLLYCDEMMLVTDRMGANRTISFMSPYLDVDFESPYGYKDAFEEVKSSLRAYLPAIYDGPYNPQKTDEIASAERNNTYLKVRVKELNRITDAIADDLEVAPNSILEFSHNALSQSIDLKLESNFIERKSILATHLNLDVSSRGDSLLVDGTAGDLYLSTLHFRDLRLQGDVKQDHINLKSFFADTTTRLAIGMHMAGDVERLDSGRRVIVQLFPSELAIDEKRWEMSSPKISIDSSRIAIDRFSIANQSEELLLDGVASRHREDSLFFRLHNFDITPLTRFATTIGYHISGYSNGSATIKSALRDAEIAASVYLDSLAINHAIKLPPLHLLSRWDFENNRANMFIVDRQKRDTAVKGLYRPSEGRYHARINADSIPMKILDPILKDVISDTRGVASARLILHGVKREAYLNGTLDLYDLATTIDYTNVEYRIPKAQIVAKNNLLQTRQAKFFDPDNNQGLLDFSLDLSHLSNISYRLEVEPDNMQVLNTGMVNNDLFYGKVYATGIAIIEGDKAGTQMNISASTSSNSTFTLPLSGSSDVNRANFVTFKAPIKNDLTDVVERKKLERENQNKERTSGGNMDITMALNIDPSLNFVLDISQGPMSGRGDGQLNIHINPRSNLFEMTGNYTFANGDYKLSLQNLINRNFSIKTGSQITWTGEPLDAMVNIEAAYNTKASLQPLLGVSEGTGNSYDRQQKVECVLKITGRLSAPSEEFNINILEADPETDAAVKNVLNNESIVSRQIGYLLLTNKFYPENATAAAESVASIASASAGIDLIISQVADFLTNEYFSLSVNYLAETETMGQGVDLNVTTNLFNERLIVELGGNYVSDKQAAVQNSQVSEFLGEVNLTYLFNRSGSMRGTAFSKPVDRFDETQGLQETGLGFSYKIDFSNWKDLKRRVKYYFSAQRRDSVRYVRDSVRDIKVKNRNKKRVESESQKTKKQQRKANSKAEEIDRVREEDFEENVD